MKRKSICDIWKLQQLVAVASERGQ